MAKQLQAEKRLNKATGKSTGAVAQFHSAIATLENSNLELYVLHEDVMAEMDRLQALLESTSAQINSNNTTIQGIKNIIGE